MEMMTSMTIRTENSKIAQIMIISIMISMMYLQYIRNIVPTTFRAYCTVLLDCSCSVFTKKTMLLRKSLIFFGMFSVVRFVIFSAVITITASLTNPPLRRLTFLAFNTNECFLTHYHFLLFGIIRLNQLYHMNRNVSTGDNPDGSLVKEVYSKGEYR